MTPAEAKEAVANVNEQLTGRGKRDKKSVVKMNL